VSRTGNLLFPDNKDDGWVTSIIKGLPEPKSDIKPVSETIEDPVAIEAEARFAELAAEVAEREAISAAGWFAEAIGPDGPPPTEESKLSEQALNALDAVIDREALKDPDITGEDDPVALAADAAFAQTAAEVAERDAVKTAGWSAEAIPSKAPPQTVEDRYSQQALDALDAVLGRDDIQSDLKAEVIDPVSLAADAVFAEVAADVIAEHAIFAAGWSAMASKPGDGVGVAELTPVERLALDAALAEEAKTPGHLTRTEDPVGLAGDAVFSEIAADVDTRDAIRIAEWTPQPTPGISPLDTSEAVRPEVLETLSPLSVSEQRALDTAQAEQSAVASDPVALEVDALFADMAADVAIEDAIQEARLEGRPDPAMVVQADHRQQAIGPGFWEIEDLVRTEAEIAFEDAAFDVAYNAVDTLVTGEAVALAAFDQAIASGADPEEALALAIAAAEEIDPKAFGLTRVAATAIVPGEGRIDAPSRDDKDEDKTGDAVRTAEAGEQPERTAEDDRSEDAITFARVGEGFEILPDEDLLFGGAEGDTLGGEAPDFEFTLDLVSGAGHISIRPNGTTSRFRSPRSSPPLRVRRARIRSPAPPVWTIFSATPATISSSAAKAQTRSAAAMARINSCLKAAPGPMPWATQRRWAPIPSPIIRLSTATPSVCRTPILGSARRER